MPDAPRPPTLTDKAKATRAERERRLAAALRENLRRRKDQGRQRAEAPPREPPDPGDA